MKYVLALIALIAVINVHPTQQTIKISPGFFTAKDYLDMTDTEKRAYVTGQMNGMLVAPFFGAPEENLAWLKTCSGKMSDEQLASIMTRYIHDQSSPQQPLNVVTFTALRQACKGQ